MKLQIPIIGLVFLCLVRIGSAEGAELRYVRIGEHKTYTRIVFEFRGEVSFKDPVITGKGRFSVIFENTTTALPMQIPAETSVRVDGIAFAQKNSQLVANIDVSFPYFEIKSFSILKPDRVVMDVTPMSKPPEGLVFEDRLERESEPEPVKVIPETPPTEIVADREVITPSTTGQKTSEEQIKAVETAKPTKPKEPVSDSLPSQIGPSEKKTKKEPAAAKELPSTQAKEKHVPRATQAPALEPHSTGLQTTLLVILLVLSTVIVALLAVIVFKKRRGVAKKEDFLDISDDREGSLAEIDDKLRRELRKIE